MKTDSQTKEECLRRDENLGALIYFIDRDSRTYRLHHSCLSWGMLSDGEKWCMVKYGNIFDSVDAVSEAIGRIIQ